MFLPIFVTVYDAQIQPNKFKEAGLKLDVTMWVPRFMQSVPGNTTTVESIVVGI